MKKKSPLGQQINRQRKDVSPVLDDIQKKLLSSAALNGGFDTLLYKIDKIEQSQGQLVSKVDKIHDAIYDPNDGIFSKLSEYKLENTNKVNEVTQELNELQLWKDIKEKDETKSEQTEGKTLQKVQELEKSIDSLVRNKNNIWAVTKWFMVAVGGGIVTLFLRWLERKI